MLDQNGASYLITLLVSETLKRLLNTLPKDILKTQIHESRPYQSEIFDYLYKTTFNSYTSITMLKMNEETKKT